MRLPAVGPAVNSSLIYFNRCVNLS